MKMKQNHKELLLSILEIQSCSYETSRMEKFILEYVESLGLTAVYDNGNIYVTKGCSANYPCIISHTDTVHKIIPDDDYTIICNDEFAIGYNRAKMEATGCGGDDKVGIFICLQMLQEFDNIKVAFFKDEEVGCLGSYDANLDFFSDVRFVLQCDRRGNEDFVNSIYGTPLQSKRFKKEIAPILHEYGYKPTTGMLTDVYALKESGVNVSVANMSCGYYNPHSDDETINLDDVTNCLEMCIEIFYTMTSVYHHEAPKKVAPVYNNYNSTYYGGYNTGAYGGYGRYYDWDDWGTDVSANTTKKSNVYESHEGIEMYNTHEECQGCLEWVEETEIVFNQDFNCYLCKSCVADLEPAAN